MTPLVSAIFKGPALTPHHALAPGQATIGHPVWGHRELLENLELRLGLPRREIDDATRLQRWSKRLGEVAATHVCFYSSSFAVDSIGTTKAVLSWRDELVLAGWEGTHIERGGPRLDTMAELEAGDGMANLAPGIPERVRRVWRELQDTSLRFFDSIELAEDLALWPALWRRVFALLEQHGSPVRSVAVEPAVPRAGSDLAVVHALLSGRELSSLPALRGDGSLLVLESETSWELGQACAALLGEGRGTGSVVLRAGEVSALNAALAARGLASQGWPAWSGWRPALQVLPLALELAFEPRDPYRVLELLTLSGGPFDGRVGRELARALSAAPGIGGRPWRQAKERLLAAGVTQEELGVAAEWLEAPGHSMDQGAPCAALLDVVSRVREWLELRLASSHAALAAAPADARSQHGVSVLGAAWAQVRAFREALEQVERPSLPLVLVRQLLEEVSSMSMLRLGVEQAGRVEHVEHAGAVRCARNEVVWWYCVSENQWRPTSPPWRRAERASLAVAGVCLVDGSARLAAENLAWRQVVLAARERLVLAIPRTALGQSLAPHPILDMIVGRLGERAPELTRVRVDVRDWLAREPGTASPLRLDSTGLQELAPLPLPEPRPEWRVRASLLSRQVGHSARSLEWLAGCPLKWVLRYRAGLSPGFLEAIASQQQLNGQLGHRLIEELHVSGDLARVAGVRSAAAVVFDRLVREEGAVLLRPGQASELAQLKAQLCQSIEHFASLLHASKLQISGVEVGTSTSWHGEALEGRIDLLLVNAEGQERIVDMKWGLNHYKQLLTDGHALQLATYAASRQLATGAREFPAAAYYSLSRGKLLTTEPRAFAVNEGVVGPSLAETWQRLESTVALAHSAFTAGRVPVTGLKLSLPMVDEREAPTEDPPSYLTLESGTACQYCDYAALCGRNWQEYA